MSCIAGAAADQRQSFVRLRLTAAALLARLGERPADHGDELVQIERLGQIFVSAPLGRGDRRHEGVLRAHDDDRQVGTQLLHARNEIEGVLVGHQHVGDDEIALALADPAPQRGGVAGRARRVAGAGERLIEHGADRGVVVGDENSCLWPLSSNRARCCAASLSAIGISARKTVSLGRESHSMMPPWSPMILATSAKPSPVP